MSTFLYLSICLAWVISSCSATELYESCISPRFQASPVEGAPFGGVVTGLELEHVTPEDEEAIESLLLRYKVLVFRNQSLLTMEGQRRFTQYFGPLHVHLESTSHSPEYADVNIISNLKSNTGTPIGLYGDHVENFHSDLSWTHLPNKVTVLKSVILPQYGGETEFLDSISAYEALPVEYKNLLADKSAHYSYLKFRDEVAGITDPKDIEYIRKGVDHPVFTTHPNTGQKNIFANPSHTVYLNNFPRAQSDQILEYLFAHTAQEKFLYVHKWQDGDVVIWDNRAVHHRATAPPNTPRKLVRTTVTGEDIPREHIDPDRIQRKRPICISVPDVEEHHRQEQEL